MESFSSYVKCPICATNDFEVFFRSTEGSQLVRCKHDGLIYRNPQESSLALKKHYEKYIKYENVDFWDRSRNEVLKREATAIKKKKVSGRLLDVGCATGVFFENFNGSDWRLYGVEPSPIGAEIARKKYDADVFVGILSEAKYPADFFDVVTILDAFYYFSHPDEELKEIKRILKNGGILAIEIPGINYQLVREKGLLCWLLDRTWSRCFSYPWHLYFFSPATLSLLLSRFGFGDLVCIPEQASLERKGFIRIINDFHYFLSRLIGQVSKGKLSFAGKEFYLSTLIK